MLNEYNVDENDLNCKSRAEMAYSSGSLNVTCIERPKH